MIELGNHHLTVLYEFMDPDTEHLSLPTYKKRGNWTLCAFGLKKKQKKNSHLVLPKGSKLSLAKPLGSDTNFQKTGDSGNRYAGPQTAIRKIQTVKMLWVRQPRLFSK